MLTASVSGDIFASPSAKQILACIQLAAFHATLAQQPRDVLIVINNYTGDRLNFGLAVEQARALHPALRVTSVLVADDVSLLARPSMVGPRGLGGNIFVCKVLGAYAAAGGTLDRAKALGDALVANLRSVGVALGHCHVPGRDDPSTDDGGIPPNQVELGLGLHNEPGVRRAPLVSPAALVAEMLDMVRESGRGWAGFAASGAPTDANVNTATEDAEQWIRPADTVVLFINNLGGVSQLEMGALVDEVVRCLATHAIRPARMYLAPFMTSLNAPGFSISLVNVSRVEEAVNQAPPTPNHPPLALLPLLDAPTEAHAWLGVRIWPASAEGAEEREREAEAALDEIRARTALPSTSAPSASSLPTPQAPKTLTQPQYPAFTPSQLAAGLRGACAAVLAAEGEMTRFDTVVGDGDCGETFAAGARAILAALDAGSLDPAKTAPAALVAEVGALLEGSMGGTIGALFAIFFTAWSTALRSPAPPTSSLGAALTALGAHTPARPGDRTVVDALAPLCAAISVSAVALSTGHVEPEPAANTRLEAAALAARRGAESTRGMGARLGRASYVGGGSGGEGVPPDPGAWGVAAIVEGFLEGVKR
ncbi:DAK1/DegV-like protein [Leucogyrophana mollusca]|uniref:DAK1/DegV-like protein n=1 Tax=Leucogyrophana mollusca TaxID=85980 RepID=A0ACB8B7E2_9AGAM|nr:DAK1/DegV-like protein [Leucogyrophana mollusca]